GSRASAALRSDGRRAEAAGARGQVAARRTARRAPARRGGIRWDRVGRYALLLTLGVIVLLYGAPAKHWIETRRSAAAHDSELRELSAEHRRLERRVRELRSPGALEREARRLGMVRQGERPFVVEGLPRR
ncbi:MAG: septum formation initiator family protein, partial [Nocardioidaceae bacterium]